MTAMTQTANQTAVVNPPDARAPTGAAQLLVVLLATVGSATT